MDIDIYTIFIHNLRPMWKISFPSFGLLLRGASRKKGWSALLLCCLLASGANFSTLNTASAAAWDVSERDRSVFTYLQKQNILTGFADGSMRPDAPISRVEALTAILRSRERFAPTIVWLQENLPAIPLFPDIEQASWYAPYVEAGYLRGIVTGYPNGTFRPSYLLTTEEAVVMLMRIYREEGRLPVFLSSDDLQNTPGEWFSDANSQAIDRNFVRSGERLSLGKPITRGAFFSLLQRAHEATERHQYAYIDAAAPAIAQQPPLSVTPSSPVPFTAGSVSLAYASDKPFAITIPKLNIHDLSIIHPTNPFDPKGILEPLQWGVGHLFSYPGSQGKTMIYGHSSSYAWDVSEYSRIFRQVNKLTPGDRIYITYEGSLYVYESTGHSIVDADDTSPFDEDGTEEVILYTCWPPDSIKQRYLVHLSPVETVALLNVTGPHVE